MRRFHQMYRPITATPFLRNASYGEYEPCAALKPYIRCFWGSRHPYRQKLTERPEKTIVIPDTCMDIIFTVDFTNNCIAGRFCGINDRSFISELKSGGEKVVSVFAVRFYPWSAGLFAEDSLQGTKNGFFPLDCHFSKLRREIAPLLFELTDMTERVEAVQKILIRHIFLKEEHPAVRNAMAEILLKRGNVKIGGLTDNTSVGRRQLERIFNVYTGVSPKQLSAMIRCQYLWRDILYSPKFDVQDAVYRYGYTDQSHLLREFKRFHASPIPEARAYALAQRAGEAFPG